jgi:hypothetical protein
MNQQEKLFQLKPFFSKKKPITQSYNGVFLNYVLRLEYNFLGDYTFVLQ